MKLCSIALLTISALTLSACGNKDSFHTGAESFLDTLTANYLVKDVLKIEQETAPVDILWVIDNSGSMSSYQNAVKNNMSLFIQTLTAKRDMDWQMALLSTDTNNAPYLGMGSQGTFDFRSSDPVGLFNAAVSRLGTGGSGAEKAIAPILKAANQNASFFRSDSVLAIFIVTDAPEQSSESVSQLLSTLAAKKADPQNIITYGAFGARDLGCPKTDDLWDYQGSKYQQLVNANGGKYFPLCSQNFGADLAKVADNISVRTQSVKMVLPVPADATSINVTYQGTPIPQTSSGRDIWRYNTSAHAVEMFDLSQLTDPNGIITVTYLRAK